MQVFWVLVYDVSEERKAAAYPEEENRIRRTKSKDTYIGKKEVLCGAYADL